MIADTAGPTIRVWSWRDALRWHWSRLRDWNKESNLEFHARTELKAAGFFEKSSDYDGMIGPAVMALVKVFAKQGHSGCSASIVRQLFDKVARFEPLCPLTGADDEWIDHGYCFQNIRCSRVFKDSKDGQAYDSQGIIWEDSDGSRWQNGESRVNITFPYTPATEYIKRAAP